MRIINKIFGKMDISELRLKKEKKAMSTPTRKCHFSPEWNVVFWWSACGEYAALITYYLPA